MTSKTDTLNRGRQKVITYGQVMEDLNYISKTSYDDTAHFDPKLKDTNNKTVGGFVFNGIATGMKLSQLLGKLGIRFIHYYPDPTPNHGELHIHPEYSQMARDLFSGWTSNMVIKRQMTGNKNLDDQWIRVVATVHQK